MSAGGVILSVFWFILFVAFIAAIVLLGVALYRMGRRRESPGWWIAAVAAGVSMLLLPFVGLLIAGLVLFIDRNSR